MSRFSQVFPPAPSFTEKQLPDLSGKVYLITGATSGLGQELAGLLYSHNATVFLGARSQAKADTTISSLQAAHPASHGRLVSVLIDLADLSTVKPGAAAFLSHPASAGKLHVLFHNAGVLAPPKGSATKAGHELALGTHAIGPQLLTRLLESRLKETAATEDKNTVRIVWVASTGATLAPQGGMDVKNLADHEKGPIEKYNISKAGAMFLCGLWAERLKANGIVNISLDPGNLKTNLQQTFSQEVSRIGGPILQLFLHPAIKGAYTELFAGFSPDVTVEKGCDHSLWGENLVAESMPLSMSMLTELIVFPWGRLVKFPRQDIIQGFSSEANGGTGNAQKFWDWCEVQIQSYL